VAGDLRVLAWIAEHGWQACVDAAAQLPAREIMLLHVAGPVHHGPGLPGRHPSPELEAGHEVADEALLTAAEERLAAVVGSAPAIRRVAARGRRPEDVVIEACAGVDVLVLARSGHRPGPRSLEHANRFVVDHAPCTVLLTWP
jgi:hypothetical protein